MDPESGAIFTRPSPGYYIILKKKYVYLVSRRTLAGNVFRSIIDQSENETVPPPSASRVIKCQLKAPAVTAMIYPPPQVTSVDRKTRGVSHPSSTFTPNRDAKQKKIRFVDRKSPNFRGCYQRRLEEAAVE